MIMKISTSRFGDIEVPEQQIFKFIDGLPGFPEEEAFAFLPQDGEEQDASFAYLQSTKTPELVFLLANPFAFFSDYEFALDDISEKTLGTSKENMPMVWSIVTIKEVVEDMTVNLVAPVLFNLQENIAMQMILDNNKFTTRHRLFTTNGNNTEEK